MNEYDDFSGEEVPMSDCVSVDILNDKIKEEYENRL